MKISALDPHPRRRAKILDTEISYVDPARIMPDRAVAGLPGRGLSRSEQGSEAGDECGGGEFDRARHDVRL